jgi:hypothetical protein
LLPASATAAAAAATTTATAFAAAIAAAPATATFSVTASAAATTAATATAATAAAAVTTAAPGTWSALARFADVDGSSLDFPTRQRLNHLRRLVIASHLDEGEAARPTSVPIHHDLHFDDIPAIFGEYLAQLWFGDVVRQISYVEPGSHLVLLGSRIRRFGAFRHLLVGRKTGAEDRSEDRWGRADNSQTHPEIETANNDLRGLEWPLRMVDAGATSTTRGELASSSRLPTAVPDVEPCPAGNARTAVH